MTSQGAGEPFAPGETIYGYQACGLKGTVYIGVEDEDGEAKRNAYCEKMWKRER